MPKVGRNTKLSRKARRVAASDPLTGTPKQVSTTETAPSRTILAAVNTTDEKSETSNQEVGVKTSQQLSRGQRKRLTKRENYLRKERLILSSLKLQRDEEQKQRIDGLDAIKQALMNTADVSMPAELSKGDSNRTVTTNKAKRRLVAEEVEHLSLVLQHPAYKQNPFATMQEHLHNVLANERKQQEEDSKHRLQSEEIGREQNLQRKKDQGVKRKKSKKKYKPRRTN
jgi:ABC-type dipeptide/oligopeptide/nickel transport system ATPase component